jgi:hypothetical protein
MYKVSGSVIGDSDARILIINEADWSVEKNVIASGIGVYEESVSSGTKTIISRDYQGKIEGFGGVSPIYYGGDGGSWVSYLDESQWEAFQGFWDTDHWYSNGWEILLHDVAAPSGTKIRITFTGTSPLNMSVRNDTGTIVYVSDASYTSGKELNINVTDSWGRIYMDGGNFNITNIELQT